MIAVPSSVRFFGAEGTSGALQPRQIPTVIKRIAVATVPIRLQFRNPTATLYATAMMTIPIVHRTICVLGARVSAPLVLDDRQQRLPTNGASYDVHVRLPEPAPVTTLPSNLFMNLLRDVAPMARPNYLETEPPSTGKSMPLASSSAGPSRPIGIIFRKHSLANPGLLWRGPN